MQTKDQLGAGTARGHLNGPTGAQRGGHCVPPGVRQLMQLRPIERGDASLGRLRASLFLCSWGLCSWMQTTATTPLAKPPRRGPLSSTEQD